MTYEVLKFLPHFAGHGRRAEFRDYEEKNSVLEAFLDAKLMQDY